VTEISFALTGQKTGRYELRTSLGAGGFGEVYRAWDTLDDVEVAVKVLQVPDYLNAQAREAFIAKFQEEAKLTRKVFRGRPNVRQVFDMGVHEATHRPWMAMELLEGETLEDQLAQRRASHAAPRSETEILTLVRPVLVELAFAHENGVAHRDIKPANIFVARTPSGPVLKVLDFGIAKVLEADETTTGNTMTSSALQMFSPHYGSPEQFAGKKTGKYTDVFALGLLLTELLTDQPPLGAGERVEHLQASLDKRERPTPKAKGRVVSPALEAAIQRSVSVVTTERQPDARALLNDIDAALEGARATATAPTELFEPLERKTGTELVQPLPFASGTEIRTEIAVAPAPAMHALPLQPSPKPTNKGILIGLAGVVIVGVIGVAVGVGNTVKPHQPPLDLSSTPLAAETSAPPGAAIAPPPTAAPTLQPMEATADAAATAPLLAPGDEMLGTYSCTVVTEEKGAQTTTYSCIIKRDDKGKLVLWKTCCSWDWYMYLSNVTDAGFAGAGTAQVSDWGGSKTRGTFERKVADRITGRVHTINGSRGQFGEWDDTVVLVRAK